MTLSAKPWAGEGHQKRQTLKDNLVCWADILLKLWNSPGIFLKKHL